MAKILIKEKRSISLGSVDSERDLKLRPGTNINPPPPDGRCDCCGKHISEVKPYGKAGDPLVGDFSGALLVKNFRPDGPYYEEVAKAVTEADKNYVDAGYKEPLDWVINKYGTQKAEGMYYANMLYHQTSSSWECRECIILDEDEYFAKHQYWNVYLKGKKEG